MSNTPLCGVIVGLPSGRMISPCSTMGCSNGRGHRAAWRMCLPEAASYTFSPPPARVDEQHPASLEGTRAAGAVFPFFLELDIFQLPSCGAAVVGGEHPGLAIVFPYRWLGEQIVPLV